MMYTYRQCAATFAPSLSDLVLSQCCYLCDGRVKSSTSCIVRPDLSHLEHAYCSELSLQIIGPLSIHGDYQRFGSEVSF